MTSPHEHLAAAVLNDWPLHVSLFGETLCSGDRCPDRSFLGEQTGHDLTLGELVDVIHAHIRQHHPGAVT